MSLGSSEEHSCKDVYMLTMASESLNKHVTCRLSFEHTDWVSDSPCMHYTADTASKASGLGIWLKNELTRKWNRACTACAFSFTVDEADTKGDFDDMLGGLAAGRLSQLAAVDRL